MVQWCEEVVQGESASGFDMPPVILIVGGIGSGKSFVAGLFEAEGGVLRIDADRIGHEVLTRPEVVAELAEALGREILTPAGEIDRRAVAARVFGSGNEIRRARLDAVTHPRIRTEIEGRIAAARKNPAIRAVVLDAAIALETGWNDLVDRIVYIDVPESERQRRVRETRGWAPEELRRRELSQWTLERKRASAHHIVNNFGSADDTRQAVREVLRDVLVPSD
jgi:dephospho-CoA kinase